jgi:transcriptional regulator with XRE-family HTH domain
MDIMDTARLNIKRHRELKGLRQQDMADKLNMNIRSYQHLENGSTRLDLERLEQIAGILETPMEDFLRQEGHYIHQEVNKTGNTSGLNTIGNIYNYGLEKETFERLLTSKEGEIKSLKDEIKYLKEKVDEFMRIIGKKD